MLILRQGQEAPDFSLVDADMKQVKSSDFKGDQNLVLFFYAKAGASACSIEAIEFTEMITKLGPSPIWLADLKRKGKE